MHEHVILLHGIWMRGFTLGLLARRLRAAGREVSCYDYASVTQGPDEGVARVCRYLDALPDGTTVHLVGHSLGGLLALDVASRGVGERLRLGRILCLGTPLRGSAVARVLAGLLPLRWTLGEARDRLCTGLDSLPVGVDVGQIAGRLPFGLGALVPGLERPHDGTVAVAETTMDGLADHAVVNTSHTGLLLSDEVAGLAQAFLQDARFPRQVDNRRAG
jgi:pimeloyl-ACP methyl ester carboxylesterase